MVFLLTFGSVAFAALLSVAGWLVARNESQHEKLASDISELKDGQTAIKAKLDMLLDGFRKANGE